MPVLTEPIPHVHASFLAAPRGVMAGPLGRRFAGLWAASTMSALGSGLTAARFGITAPFWAGFVVAVIVSASTWRVFNPAAVAQAYAEPD
jgi:hypothetical protein